MRYSINLVTLLMALFIAAPYTQASTRQPLDINQASQSQLQTIKGIGDSKARNIVRYRQQNGPFQKMNELAKVTGFGHKMVSNLKADTRLTVNQDQQANNQRLQRDKV